MSDQLALPTDPCALDGCEQRFAQTVVGRPRLYCSGRCRQAALRRRNATRVDPAGLRDKRGGGA